jgi:HNH endonuclease
VTVDTKPERRYRATLAEWEWFRTWFALERCWVCEDAWQELHHIYPRGQGGDDDIVDLAPVCRECHRHIEARDPVARSLLRQALMPTNLEYLRGKLGDGTLGWLDRNYPVSFSCDPCECGGQCDDCQRAA